MFTADALTEAALLIAAFSAGAAAFALRSTWHALFGIVLALLSIDEGMDVHERIGLWAESRGAASSLLNDADSAVLGVYGLTVLAIVVFGWPHVQRPLRRAIYLAALAGTVAVTLDAFAPRLTLLLRGEEYLELLSAASLASGLAVTALRSVRRHVAAAGLQLS